MRTTIVTFLELEGFEVEAVSNTRDALNRLADREYPLVISDIYVDDRTGIDVLMAAQKTGSELPGDSDDGAGHRWKP